ncbi:suppressor of cytokine signaling 1a [Thalassophryne amazonica]|uniref:suppressor of cytokine signaling 1a n=1 Tax=Thalassophryne amazonica TaxID=390379 RepID=UPI001471A067|nr:suppressor of cytokine signaling 1a [Thalassophryne amazonica]
MVADSSVEGHDKTQLSSSSSSSSPPSSLLPRQDPTQSPRRTESQLLQARSGTSHNPNSVLTPSVFLTHFPPFRCQKDFTLITDTAAKLERSGFYWGPLGVEDAHRMLRDAALGSYLIRDSRQKDVFFTLSYRAESGPVSVRIEYKRQKFSLVGSERTFLTLFALLEHYSNSPKKSLSIPYRKWKPTLQELCRKRIVELCRGRNWISELPLNRVVQDFMLEFPYRL